MKLPPSQSILGTAGAVGVAGSGISLWQIGELSDTTKKAGQQTNIENETVDSSQKQDQATETPSTTEKNSESTTLKNEQTSTDTSVTTKTVSSTNDTSGSTSTTTVSASKPTLSPKDLIPNPNATRSTSSYQTEVWGCTKKLFPENLYNSIKHDKTQYNYFNRSGWLNWRGNGWRPLLEGRGQGIFHGDGLNQNLKDKTIGCAVTQIKPIGNSTGHNRDFYLKSEVVVKNDRIGLILWTDWATSHHQSKGAMTHRMMLIINKTYNNTSSSDTWVVGGGLWWNDNNFGYHPRRNYIQMPGDTTPWYSSEDSNSKVDSEKHWAGVWTTDGSDDTNKSQLYEKIYISSGGTDKSELLGTPRIPFETSPSKRWCGWYYGGYYYEARTGWQQGWWGFLEFQNIQRELKSWYKAFRDLKGSWKKYDEACPPANTANSSYEPLKKFCSATVDNKKK